MPCHDDPPSSCENRVENAVPQPVFTRASGYPPDTVYLVFFFSRTLQRISLRFYTDCRCQRRIVDAKDALLNNKIKSLSVSHLRRGSGAIMEGGAFYSLTNTYSAMRSIIWKGDLELIRSKALRARPSRHLRWPCFYRSARPPSSPRGRSSEPELEGGIPCRHPWHPTAAH